MPHQNYNWIDRDVLLAIAARHTYGASIAQIKDFIQAKSTIRLRDAEFINATDRLREGGWVEPYGRIYRLTPRALRVAPELVGNDDDAKEAAIERIFR